jgi:hypothetical protein
VSNATVTVLFRDFRGFTGRTTGVIQAASGTAMITAADALANAWVGMSNAVEVSRSGLDSGQVNPNSYGSNSEYADIGQKARLIFADTSGQLHSMSVPAPKAAVFLSDGVTVDKTQTNVAAIITLAAAGTILFGKQGLSGVYVNGFFQDRRRKRLISSRTLNPAGTGPA